jgi:hypothetical protein
MDARREPRTLRDYLAVVRRRKWVILLAVLATPLASVQYRKEIDTAALQRAESEVQRELRSIERTR